MCFSSACGLGCLLFSGIRCFYVVLKRHLSLNDIQVMKLCLGAKVLVRFFTGPNLLVLGYHYQFFTLFFSVSTILKKTLLDVNSNATNLEAFFDNFCIPYLPKYNLVLYSIVLTNSVYEIVYY